MEARTVFIGRPVLWGLAYNVRVVSASWTDLIIITTIQGEDGVSQLLQTPRDELKQAMIL